MLLCLTATSSSISVQGPVALVASAHAMAGHSSCSICESAWGEVPWRATLTVPPEKISAGGAQPLLHSLSPHQSRLSCCPFWTLSQYVRSDLRSTVTDTNYTLCGVVLGAGIFELSSERPGLGITLSEECLAEHGFELKIPPLQCASL